MKYLMLLISSLNTSLPPFPFFNNRLAKEMDERLYVIKYEQIPTWFHSTYMQKVDEKLAIFKMTAEERIIYSYYQKQLYNDHDELETVLLRDCAKGEREGIQKGGKDRRKEENIAIAKKLLEAGSAVNLIASTTGLEAKEIKNLRLSTS